MASMFVVNVSESGNENANGAIRCSLCAIKESLLLWRRTLNRRRGRGTYVVYRLGYICPDEVSSPV